MGREVVKAIDADQGFALGAAWGRLQGGLADGNGFDVVIDFTVPAAALQAVSLCGDQGKPIVVGTTGFDAEGRARIARAAQKIPVVLSSNLSLTGNQLFRAGEDACRRLGGKNLDVEIIEVHHSKKLDEPSGTTLQLGQRLLAGFWPEGGVEVARRIRRREDLDETHADRCEAAVRPVLQRYGQGTDAARPRVYVLDPVANVGGVDGGRVTITVYRVDCPFLCWHNVRLSLPNADERFDIAGEVPSRAVFAQGALRAAKFLEGRAAGLYGMEDVLGV